MKPPEAAAVSATTSADCEPPLPDPGGGFHVFFRALHSMDPPLYSRKIPKGFRSRDTSTAAASSDAAKDAAAPGSAACRQTSLSRNPFFRWKYSPAPAVGRKNKIGRAHV